MREVKFDESGKVVFDLPLARADNLGKMLGEDGYGYDDDDYDDEYISEEDSYGYRDYSEDDGYDEDDDDDDYYGNRREGNRRIPSDSSGEEASSSRNDTRGYPRPIYYCKPTVLYISGYSMI
jgi:hypothetical protein